MSLQSNIDNAIFSSLKPEPREPEFEERITELYKIAQLHSIMASVPELKQRFLVYWTHEVLVAATAADADEWQVYMDRVMDSPDFLDLPEVVVMANRIRLCTPLSEPERLPHINWTRMEDTNT